MSNIEQVQVFKDLHVKGKPLLLVNAWDAGSAKAIAEAGAAAIATSSWAVAAAQGYSDGEKIPLDFVHKIVGRIIATVEIPVSLDFEGGYSDDDGVLSENISNLVELGVAGINFEDRFVRGKGLYDMRRQAARIAAVRAAADRVGGLFINARSDVFFQGNEPAEVMDGALERARAYANAGADGFFVPGLIDADLIGQLTAVSLVPINIMIWDGLPPLARLAELGLAMAQLHMRAPMRSSRPAPPKRLPERFRRHGDADPSVGIEYETQTAQILLGNEAAKLRLPLSTSTDHQIVWSATMSDTATAIMDAAERRIRMGGFGGFSFRELAADVGIKSSSVHYHFPTKDRLAAAVVDRYAIYTSDTVDKFVKADADPAKAWVEAFRTTVNSPEHICPATVLGASSQDLPPEVAKAVHRFYQMCLDKLAAAGMANDQACQLLSTITGAMVLANAMHDVTVYDIATHGLVSLH